MFFDALWNKHDVKHQRRPSDVNSFRPRIETLEARDCPAVATPTGVQLQAISATQVRVTWADVAGEVGYRVYGWDGVRTVLVGTVNPNITTFTANNLRPNQIQWFTIEAFNATTRGRSGWVSIMTPPEAITAPTNARVGAVTQTSVTLGWGLANGALGYKVFRWDGTRSTEIASVSRTTTSHTINFLTPGQNYYFYVQAYNNTNFASSDWVNITTTSQSLQAPTNLRLQVLSTSSIQINWNDAGGETGYRIYGWNNSTSSAYLVTTLPANTTSSTVTGLLAGRTYWFYVQAFNAFGTTNTAWVTATTTSAPPLQAPTSVNVVSTGPTSVNVSWVESTRAVGYRIFYWNGLSWSLNRTVAAGTNQVSITGLATDRTHWFMIQAYTDGFAEVMYSSAKFINL